MRIEHEVKIRESTNLSAEIRELQMEARNHLSNSKSENTKRAYQNDWVQFLKWCEKNRFSELPAEPETIVYYITYLGKSHKAPR